jgi:YARHG domain-containing protein
VSANASKTVLRNAAAALLLLIIGGAVISAAPLRAGDDSDSGVSYYSGLTCGQLWQERNAIFAQYGYCFTSRQAISVFGKGCFSPFGKLPNHKRNVVSEIKSWERKRGC